MKNSSDWIQFGILLTIFFTAIVALLTYWRQIEMEKRQFTFNQAASFYTEDLLRARLHLASRISDVQSSVTPIKLNARDIATFISKSAFSNKEDKIEFESSLLLLSDFFNASKLCSEEELCDRTLLTKLLRDDAESVMCDFYLSYANLQTQANLEGLTEGLAYFSEGREC